MSNFEIRKIRINDINVDEKNPRLEPANSQKEAINSIMEDQGDKLISLIKHISENGLNPTARILVFKENGKLIDGDGNRRVAAIKIVHTLNLLDDEIWIRKIGKIKVNIANFPNEIECAVFENRNKARVWIRLNHDGQGDGEGTIPWSSTAKDRFNNINSIGTQFIENYVDAGKRSRYQKTTMDRFFGSKFIKEKLNINLQDGKITFGDVEDDKTKTLIGALESIKVSEVYDNKKITEFYNDKLQNNNQPNKPGESASQVKPGRPSTNAQKGVIPRDLTLEIKCQKTNNIFNELKKIQVEQFPNASAILLRAFLELSVDYYIAKTKKNIPKDMKLLGRLQKIYKEMDLSKDEKKVLDIITSNKNNPAHTNVLNSYIHNKNHHPDPDSIKIAFDNLTVFFKKAYEE